MPQPTADQSRTGQSQPATSVDVRSFTTLAQFEEAARTQMSSEMYTYTQKTAGTGQTQKNNLAAYAHYGILPRVLSGIEDARTEATLLGQKVSCPVILAPTPWHRLFHEGGERATSLAAKTVGTNFIASCFSSMNFSEIGGESTDSNEMKHVWYQMLLHKDEAVMLDFIARAEAAGCGGIVLSVDAPAGCRMCSAETNPSAPKIGLPPSQLPLLPISAGNSPVDTLDDYYRDNLSARGARWDYVGALIQRTKIPVILKGVLRREDVEMANEVGAAAVVISNHGGRQIDGALSTLDALQQISGNKELPLKTEIYMDGGIRSGADIFKALALGAKAVLIGRPTLYGLAVGGQAGVEHVLNLLKAELSQCMLLSGCADLSKINRGLLCRI